MSPSAQLSGSQVIAQALKDQGVTHIFGIVGIPVIEVAQACIDLGIRFISFRNEQSASYAASAYGYLTGRPGVLLVVGGPGVIHALAGVCHAASNSFPLLMLAGASESFQTNQGAFQEMDQVAFLKPETKFAARPPSLDKIPTTIEQAYRAALLGRPGPSYVDLPADYIQGSISRTDVHWPRKVGERSRSSAKPDDIRKMVDLLEAAERPLVVIGKGAQLSGSEAALSDLLSILPIPFLPTPMGKGHLPDSHPLCIAAARSTALKSADVVLVLGARLNWILHYGAAPKWAGTGKVKWLRVDVKAEELDDNQGAEVGVVGDVRTVVEQLTAEAMKRRRGGLDAGKIESHQSQWHGTLLSTVAANEKKALAKSASPAFPMTYHQAFSLILPHLPKDHVFVSEGANTLDIGRSFFPVEAPRSRLDSGSTATMGVGLGFAIAAAVAERETAGGKGRKVVAIVGDSAFGFSAMEVETAARNKLGMMIVVMNNSGVYQGLSPKNYSDIPLASLPPTALTPEVRYDLLATACGAVGYLARTPDELSAATIRGIEDQEKGVVTVINVLMNPGKVGGKVAFGWQASTKKESKL